MLIFVVSLCLLGSLFSFSPVHASDVTLNGTVPLQQGYEDMIAANSQVYVVPTSAAIGGTVNVIAQILDSNGNPLANHTVDLGVIGVSGVTLTQSNDITNAEGMVEGSLTSTVGGLFQVYAIDNTYKTSYNTEILIEEMPTVQFGTAVTSTPTPTPTSSPTPTKVKKHGNSFVSVGSTTPTTTGVSGSGTPTPTPTPSPTATPQVLPSASGATGTNPLWQLLNLIFGFTVCGATDSWWPLSLVVFVPYLFLYKFYSDRKSLVEGYFIYTLTAVVGYYLMRFICLSYLLSLIIWGALIIIGLGPIRSLLARRGLSMRGTPVPPIPTSNLPPVGA